MIATPMIVAVAIISLYIIVAFSGTFPKLIDIAKDLYVTMDFEKLESYALLRSEHVSTIVTTSLRDLFLLNRIAGWLFAGAMTVADGHSVSVHMAAEQCKASDPITKDCARHTEISQTCDCAWNDPWGRDCADFTSSQRASQVLSFEGLNEDAFANGERNFTSFPNVGTSPSTTSFWSDVTSLPGFQTQSNNLDYTYGRTRVASSLATVQIPLYNYVANHGTKQLERTWGSFLALDTAGSLSGYAGCNHDHAFYAFQQAGQQFDTYDEALCPTGKYG